MNLLNEPVEETQSARYPGEMAGKDQCAKRDQQYPAPNLYLRKMALEISIKTKEAVYCERREQERNRQSERIYPEQQNALHQSAFGCSQCEDSSQNRSDAWRPAKRKCEPDNKSANR